MDLQYTMCNIYRDVCLEQWERAEQSEQYTCALLALQFALPLSALVWTYARIAHAVWGGRPPGEAHCARDSRMQRSKRKVSNTQVHCLHCKKVGTCNTNATTYSSQKLQLLENSNAGRPLALRTYNYYNMWQSQYLIQWMEVTQDRDKPLFSSERPLGDYDAFHESLRKVILKLQSVFNFIQCSSAISEFTLCMNILITFLCIS